MVGELIEISASRRAFYGMLSGLFYKELDKRQIDSFCRLRLSEVAFDDDEMNRGFEMISHYFKTKIGDVRQDLAVDYAHAILAIGSHTDHMAIPFESVFTSSEGLLMQEARDDVYRFFCQEHLGVAEGTDVPEDHLSFAFEFMSALCDRFEKALLDGCVSEAKTLLETQCQFHRKLLLNWIDS